MVDCHGTEKIATDAIEALVREHFDLRPAAIIRDLDLRRPIYRKTSTYGHFGRSEPTFTWESTEQAAELKAALASGARPEMDIDDVRLRILFVEHVDRLDEVVLRHR